MTSSSPPRPHSRALVIGGSITGMCVARALSGHYDRVTIVDRDRLPLDEAAPRRGVPQSLQPHFLQAVGRAELDRMFPGFLDGLRAEGAVEMDLCAEMARYTPWGWAPRHVTGVRPIMSLRITQETVLRRLFRRQLPEVEWFEETKVLEPLFVMEGSVPRVTGVRTDRRGDIEADLVVDASGRGSKALKWFEQMGLPRPNERIVDSHTNYACRHYRAPKAARSWWWKAMMIDARVPDVPRACSLFTYERDTWLVTAMGMDGDYAPSKNGEWLEYVRNMRSPVLAEVLKHAEPLTDVIQTRTTQNIWREMHKWKGKVRGFLLCGDPVVAFNPLYGQGITSTVVAARLLDELLSQHGSVDEVLFRKFYRRHAKLAQEGWSFSADSDFRWPGTEGRRPPLNKLSLWLTDIATRLSLEDPIIYKTLAPLADFGANRWSVMTPGFLARAYYHFLRVYVLGAGLPGAGKAPPLELPERTLPMASVERT